MLLPKFKERFEINNRGREGVGVCWKSRTKHKDDSRMTYEMRKNNGILHVH